MNAKEHYDFRMKLWSELTIAFTRADNSSHASGASEWADRVMRDFDSRFAPDIPFPDDFQKPTV